MPVTKIKNLCILGSTGSIGTQALSVVRRHPQRFKVSVLAAHSNVALLSQQYREFKPDLVALSCEKAQREFKRLFPAARVIGGINALSEAASYDKADTVVAAVVGMDGFSGVYEAVSRGKTVALANKETLVAGGKIIMELAQKTAAQILPVDSEHSAVFQCLQGGANTNKNLRRIILTASGGAFYGKNPQELSLVTPEQATRHPSWSMGKKITVDSSTMMNKALEIIEARWLFDTHNIDYVVHPESIIHSMVEFTDGTLTAQLSYPSMEYPIQLALTYPERLETGLPAYTFTKPLTFLPPDEKTFFFPKLAKQALSAHEGAPLVLNAANEAAVSLFLNNRIGFIHIFDMVRRVMEKADYPVLTDKNSVIAAHKMWYDTVISDYKHYIKTE
ncbi:MAG: 1-deoxy-D-xylulose-5-phosphate reductoisomerase [Firmicutes bacterium]|nr:1-deoxy-D-xylulose-5-phosphate reductoisomerase [Bacillota bacterium]